MRHFYFWGIYLNCQAGNLSRLFSQFSLVLDSAKIYYMGKCVQHLMSQCCFIKLLFVVVLKRLENSVVLKQMLGGVGSADKM